MLKFLIIQGINIYQKVFSFIREGLGLPKTVCRFYPKCSEYSKQVLEKYGLFKGCLLSIKRLLKCNPWCNGGLDLP